MTNKIARVIIKIITISLIFQIVTTPVVRAESFWAEIFEEGRSFVGNGKRQVINNPIMNEGDVSTLNTEIYNILLALGIVLSVIIGGILGIQMMWGSIEQQVKAKEKLMPYAIGCVVIFGAFGIWKICVIIFSQL